MENICQANELAQFADMWVMPLSPLSPLGPWLRFGLLRAGLCGFNPPNHSLQVITDG